MADPQVDDWVSVPAQGTPTAPQQGGDWVSVPPPPDQNLITAVLNTPSPIPGFQGPTGVAQGVGKGAASTVVGLINAYRKLTGQPPLDPTQTAPYTVPSQPGQGTGKFLEQAGEFAIPAGEVADAVKSYPLVARMLAQGALGAGVAGAQSGGDPNAMKWGAALGGGGELAGSTIRGLLAARKLPNVPTLENFRDAFAATPSQLPAVQDAMPVMAKYGVNPEDSIQEMQDSVRGKLADLGQQYQALEAAGLSAKTMKAQDLIVDLQKLKQPFMKGTHVASGAKDLVNTIDEQIQDVKNWSDANGDIDFASVRKLRDLANSKTNFQTTDDLRNVYNQIGDSYRGGMDQIEPGIRSLNSDYAKLTGADNVLTKNLSYGRGVVPSRLGQELQRNIAGPMAWSNLGRTVGAMTGIPGAATVGGTVGAMAGPRLTGATLSALQKAADNGMLGRLPQATKAALTYAARLGDNESVMRMLQTGSAATGQEAVARAPNTQ